MQIASNENVGQVLPRAHILLRDKKNGHDACYPWNTYFICVKLYGRYQWQKIDNISVPTFKKHKDNILSIFDHKLDASKINKYAFPIEITGSNNNFINGIYYPIPSTVKSS